MAAACAAAGSGDSPAAMLIAQITDPHLAPGAPLYGYYHPGAALARVVAALNALDPRPDLVLLTGDLANDAEPEAYRIAERVLGPLAIPLAGVPGNHDDRALFREALLRLGGRASGEDGRELVIEAGPVRLIGLDTLDSTVAPAGRLDAARLASLDARLADEPDRPTVLFMHHPPFPVGMSGLDAIGCLGAAELHKILTGRPGLRRILAGHVHRAVQGSWAGVTVSTAPSVAFAFALDLAAGSAVRPEAHPPGFQLHKVELDGAVLTHTMFLP